MKYLIAVLISLISIQSHATWKNLSGKVTSLTTYANTETILVTLPGPGDDVSECSNKNTFAISKDISPEARARMYSFLLAAKLSNSSVTIAYNDQGNCEPWSNTPNVYRKILRLY